MSSTKVLLRELRLQGVRLAAHGDRLHVEAPSGVVSAETRERLAAAKMDILAQLATEDRLTTLSCEEFARQRFAIEFRIPALADTLWLVPQSGHVARLVSEGIRRGRIFTAHEVADLLSLPNLTADDFQRIVRLKAAFGAEIVAAQVDSDVGMKDDHARV